MEQGRAKKNPQPHANCIIQQKVFKFHNVSEEIILGNKKGNKVAKKKTKSTPSHTISGRKDDPKEKMAKLIFKQFVPIRRKCLTVEPSQTKSNKEKVFTKLAKMSLSSCVKSLQYEINKKQSNKISEIPADVKSMLEPTNGKVNDLDIPSVIRLVDITLLKEPSNNTGSNLFANNTISYQTLSTGLKYNSTEEMTQVDAPSNHLYKTNGGEEAPLDLSKKGQPPEPPNEEHYPLDLSNKDRQYQYGSVGEPPPLMPIQRIPQQFVKAFTPVISTANNLNDSNKRVEKFVEFQSIEQTNPVNLSNNPSLNKENQVSPQFLNLQPIPLVFTTNPVLHAMQTQTVWKDPIMNTDTPSPTIQNVPKDFTKELIGTKLIEKSRNKPSPESQIPEVPSTQANLVQPIKMVFTGGQFVQLLPSQNIQENIQPVFAKLNTNISHTKTDQIKIVKNPRKKESMAGEIKGSLPVLLHQKQIIHQNKRLKIEDINEKSHQYKNKDNNNDTTKDKDIKQNSCKIKRLEFNSFQTPDSLVKTNETVTSNGGVFCTFKNVKRMKMVNVETKRRRKKSKPDQSDVI
eukprot:GFUD01003003.1.p1 GENE.GFUD01003003.1~~GFUD01003003.1.p1  ORF type:complete len:571 (-),score=138.90 GFUD01003003.1:54-1766(-)